LISVGDPDGRATDDESMEENPIPTDPLRPSGPGLFGLAAFPETVTVPMEGPLSVTRTCTVVTPDRLMFDWVRNAAVFWG
jgi:hypothetical protein